MMGFGQLSHLFYPWGFLLQGLALVHFLRKRPDTYWLYIILFIGPIGAAIYLVAEVLPDLGSLGSDFKVFPRRQRIRQLLLILRDNPSTGNYEELGDLYLEDHQWQLARQAYDHAITPRHVSLDAFYRRAQCALQLNDPAAALPDLERVVAADPTYDYHRAAGLLAHTLALTGDKPRAEALFQRVTLTSTLSETYLNYAQFLRSEGRIEEARAWARKVLDKKPTLPGYLRRRERPWFRSATQLLKQLPA